MITALDNIRDIANGVLTVKSNVVHGITTATDGYLLVSDASATGGAIWGSSINVEDLSLDGYVEQSVSTLAYDGYVNLDLALSNMQSVSLAGNVTFTTSNGAAGRALTLRIIADGSTRNLTFPAWVFLGDAPTDIAASKTGVLSLASWGTTDGAIVAAYAVES